MTHRERIGRLQERIGDRGLSGAVLFYSRDTYYYSGTAQPAYLVVLPDDYRLFIRRGYDVALEESDLETGSIQDEKSFEGVARSMFPGAGTGEKLGTELDMLTVNQAREMTTVLGDRELVDISGDILDQRMVKDESEIESIRKACRAVHAGHLATMSCLGAGMTELDLSVNVEAAHRLAGHEGCFFIRLNDFIMSRGPLASGPNLLRTSGTLFTLCGAGMSPAIPTGASMRAIERGDLVMVDIPTCVEGYHADQARTYAVASADEEAMDLFERLRGVSDRLVESMRPGMSCGEAFSMADEQASILGIGEYFMRMGSGSKVHFIGHGIGLEVNESPVIARNGKAVLVPGMVVTVELHLVTPSGIAMKLEDSVLLGRERNEILTISPRELAVVSN
jgi:Xaa-Pro dipeptidase